MGIRQLIEDQGLSLYELAERSGLSYSVVHSLVRGKSDICRCSVDTAVRLSRALHISVEDLLLCEKGRTRTWFRSEQCHQVRRKGELKYLIDVLESMEIDRYWRLSMYFEALYVLAMIDYISRRNSLPLCENYNELRGYQLDHVTYPIDVTISHDLLQDEMAYARAEAGAIPEFRQFNIVEGEIFDDDVA